MQSGRPGLGLLLRRRGLLPEGTTCLAALEGGDVASGSSSGVQVIASRRAQQDGSPLPRLGSAGGFEATCLAALGSQTLAAGDAAGVIRVWHWRRRTLKEVAKVHVHQAAVRALSNGGDILLTASEDGTVKQLNVIEGFMPADFFSPGVPATSVLARGKHVLVGCKDGVVWELSRRSREPSVIRRLELGAAVLCLDADAPAEGARVLAAGGGRIGVWLDAPVKPGKEASETAQQPAFAGSWDPDGKAAVLLPSPGRGTVSQEDFLTIGCDGLLCGIGKSGTAWGSAANVQDELGKVRASAGLVPGSPDVASFLFAAEMGKADDTTWQLFELERPPASEASEEAGQVSFATSLAAAQYVDASANKATDDKAVKCETSSFCQMEGSDEVQNGAQHVSRETAPMKTGTSRRTSTYADPTEASLARSSGSCQ
eukprot:TRINITY_DN49451_c0_g1_i1.p1 TRINITY_DN49451_c0_g1~~TRINITY_DN49451_c0_g1_i1.p1  ORF type:complete len:428 (+),score=111.58 TRINITY_DN49451_c0_g1_i1:22-1305(+)